MKVHVKTDTQEEFKPYTIAITITSKEESIYFHDKVMPVLSEKTRNHPVYAAIYHAGNGKTVDEKGEI